MDELFRAVADPTRRAILDELVDRNGQSLFELCSRLTMKHGISSTRQAISQHLEVLESAGLVTAQRQGRFKFHWFNGAPLRAIVKRWLEPQAGGGHANQRHERVRRRPGDGAALLHRHPRVRKKTRHPAR
ncbi:MAG: helix-turn-helix transcriptional regulator [Phycisphaerae bacterium]